VGLLVREDNFSDIADRLTVIFRPVISRRTWLWRNVLLHSTCV